MRLTMITLLLAISLILITSVIAQNTATPRSAESFLTATQLAYELSETAAVEQGITQNAPDDGFALTSTMIVIEATQTGLASGSSSVPLTSDASMGAFQETSTQYVLDVTQTALAFANAQIIDDEGDDPSGEMSSLNLTLIAFGLVVVALVVLGIIFTFISSRTNNQNQG